VAEAAAMMAEGRGTHFDPEVLDTFMLAVPVPA
jgi:HD-GYP domain-containing protein (c-di-GMP phosphodiesterase class II)